MSSLKSKILQIAQQNPEGFTVEIPNCEFVKSGWVIALKETQNSFGLEGLQKVIQVAIEKTNTVGGWKNENDYYYDACIVVSDEDEATKLGIENEQIAIYNIEQNRVKFLK